MHPFNRPLGMRGGFTYSEHLRVPVPHQSSHLKLNACNLNGMATDQAPRYQLVDKRNVANDNSLSYGMPDAQFRVQIPNHSLSLPELSRRVNPPLDSRSLVACNNLEQSTLRYSPSFQRFNYISQNGQNCDTFQHRMNQSTQFGLRQGMRGLLPRPPCPFSNAPMNNTMFNAERVGGISNFVDRARPRFQMVRPGFYQNPREFGQKPLHAAGKQSELLPARQGRHYSKTSKRVRKPRTRDRDKDSCTFFCETCDRGYNDREKFQEHNMTHVPCRVKGCRYVAAEKLVAIHYNTQHRTGLAAKIWSVESDEDMKRWRTERRRNYPTAQTIETKRTKLEERRERGRVVENEYFGKMYRNERGDHKRHSDQQAVSVSPSMSTPGVHTNSDSLTGVDDCEPDAKCAKLDGSLSEAVEERPMNHRQTFSNRKRTRRRPYVDRNPASTRSIPQRRASLLQKLLAGDIRRERNLILQCVRYVVRHQFFDGDRVSGPANSSTGQNDNKCPDSSTLAVECRTASDSSKRHRVDVSGTAVDGFQTNDNNDDYATSVSSSVGERGEACCIDTENMEDRVDGIAATINTDIAVNSPVTTMADSAAFLPA